MLLFSELLENWETYPDNELKEKVSKEEIREALKNFDNSVNDDDWIWYPFASVYNYPPLKDKVKQPSKELLEEINKWEGKILGTA